ncbi:10404_t:CDS:1 [Dentiscutata erythropus]|uniref:10404_t:CDS:1 n=1 Tax=Dentiscutata erythropus TaxID=1348616 RepID=A0A9N8YXT4_9GLOM|nr:10404_t:CDS:1 [Dentiscutata erythropus]
MYKAQWREKLAKNKNGDPPNDEHFSLIEIIYRLPRTEIFNPCQDARKIYPHQNKRRSKGDPRPMNSFMILTLVVRKVADSLNVDLGDGRSCIRICQLMRWGASKDEWGIYLSLQKEFRKIHSRFYPTYDYRKKPQVADTKEFVVVNSDDYKAEYFLTESRNNKKIASPTVSSSSWLSNVSNGRMTTNLPGMSMNISYQAIPSPQDTSFSTYNDNLDFISQLSSPENFSPCLSPVSQVSSFIVSNSPSGSHEGIVPSSSTVVVPQVSPRNTIISSSPPITQISGQDIIPSSPSVTQVDTQNYIVPSIPRLSLPQSFYTYPTDAHFLERHYQNMSLPTIAVNCPTDNLTQANKFDFQTNKQIDKHNQGS